MVSVVIPAYLEEENLRVLLPRIRDFTREALADFLAENLPHLTEDEALAVLENRYVTSRTLQALPAPRGPRPGASSGLRSSP